MNDCAQLKIVCLDVYFNYWPLHKGMCWWQIRRHKIYNQVVHWLITGLFSQGIRLWQWIYTPLFGWSVQGMKNATMWPCQHLNDLWNQDILFGRSTFSPCDLQCKIWNSFVGKHSRHIFWDQLSIGLCSGHGSCSRNLRLTLWFLLQIFTFCAADCTVVLDVYLAPFKGAKPHPGYPMLFPC